MNDESLFLLILIGFALLIFLIIIYVYISEKAKREEFRKTKIYEKEQYQEMLIDKITELEKIARAISLDKIGKFLDLNESEVKHLIKKAVEDFDYIIDGDYLTKKNHKKVIQEEMKTCILCGKEISHELKFCNYCGIEQK